jgi:hypothetical protein
MGHLEEKGLLIDANEIMFTLNCQQQLHKNMLRTAFLLFFSLLMNITNAQDRIPSMYHLSNEEIIMAIQMNDGKIMTLCKDTADHYLLYRFGTKSKIELEFPSKENSSWSLFTYSYYFRGGGAQNAGLDLNYVYFEKEGYRYIIYDTYDATENLSEEGIKVENLKTGEMKVLAGKKMKTGSSLIDFRDNTLIQKSEKMFD